MNVLSGRPRAVEGKGASAPMPLVMGVIAASLLAGCGGSSSGDSGVEDVVAFSLDRDSVECKASPEGDCATVTIYATPTHMERKDRTPLLVARSVDGAPGIPVAIASTGTQLPDGRWQMQVKLSPDRPAGVYVGAIHVDMPLDVVAPAGKRYRGARLSYRLEVNAVTPSSAPLPAVVAGASSWSEAPGGPTRSGYVPVTLDAAKFSRRWMSWVVGGTDTTAPGTPALVDGQILLPQARPFGATAGTNALALSELDGKPQWTATLPGTTVTQVTAAGNNVAWAVQQATSTQHTAYVTSRSGGAVIASKLLSDTNPPRFWLGTDDSLYVSDRNKGTLEAINLADMQSRWTATVQPSPGGLLPVVMQYGPTVADGVVYAHAGTTFRAFRASDGAQLLDTTADGGQTLSLKLYESQTPVIADATTVLAMDRPRYVSDEAGVNAGIQAMSRVDGSVRWTVRQPFRGLPVTANGLFYVANQGSKTIEARQVADGALVWSWPMETGDKAWQPTMVLTDSHLIVSTDRQTVAIDLTSRQAVWRYPLGGWLGMTQRGTLVVVTLNSGSTNGPTALSAFDMR